MAAVLAVLLCLVLPLPSLLLLARMIRSLGEMMVVCRVGCRARLLDTVFNQNAALVLAWTGVTVPLSAAPTLW